MILGYNPVWQALLGTLLTWGLTAAGSALVFIFSSRQRRILDGSLGFAAGEFAFVDTDIDKEKQLSKQSLGSLNLSAKRKTNASKKKAVIIIEAMVIPLLRNARK